MRLFIAITGRVVWALWVDEIGLWLADVTGSTLFRESQTPEGSTIAAQNLATVAAATTELSVSVDEIARRIGDTAEPRPRGRSADVPPGRAHARRSRGGDGGSDRS